MHVYYLHVYCQRLSGTVTEDDHKELILKVRSGHCSLRSLHIFAAELPWFQAISLRGNSEIEFALYHDVQSGPAAFWIKREPSAHPAVHVLQNEMACLDRDSPEVESRCDGVPHLVLDASAGFRIHGSQPPQLIPSVHPDEISAASAAEMTMFGDRARRLHNLPRLLDNLFTSAGEELMGPQPSIPSITAKLRFITRCARHATLLAGLVSESEKLLNRLELPPGPVRPWSCRRKRL